MEEPKRNNKGQFDGKNEKTFKKGNRVREKYDAQTVCEMLEKCIKVTVENDYALQVQCADALNIGQMWFSEQRHRARKYVEEQNDETWRPVLDLFDVLKTKLEAGLVNDGMRLQREGKTPTFHIMVLNSKYNYKDNKGVEHSGPGGGPIDIKPITFTVED